MPTAASGTIAVAGHNIKLGRGGIREIEFFVQTQQLIAGGRQPDLRVPRTLEALQRLAAARLDQGIGVSEELAEAYVFLRGIEHRLQMVADEQTQTLPDDPARLAGFARFCGYADAGGLLCCARGAPGDGAARTTRRCSRTVPSCTSGGANMVFAGEQDDPATVEALASMGYDASRGKSFPPCAAGIMVANRAVRTPRARERLTEVQPLLIDALAETADPDRALASFDRFLTELPSGVQLFSLLRANPRLLRLVADIMGTAPRLARILSRRRRLLDAVLDPGVLGAAPDGGGARSPSSTAELAAAGMTCRTLLDRARVVGSEQAFLIGVRVLSGTINASQAGGAYALLAERLIGRLKAAVEHELERAHGRVPGGAAVVVAMGKLGGREMTAAPISTSSSSTTSTRARRSVRRARARWRRRSTTRA